MMPERHLGGTKFPGSCIEDAVAEFGAQGTRSPSGLLLHGARYRVGAAIKRDTIFPADVFKRRRIHLSPSRVHVYREQFESQVGVLLQQVQHEKESGTVFPAGKAHRYPVALSDHVVILYGLLDLCEEPCPVVFGQDAASPPALTPIDAVAIILPLKAGPCTRRIIERFHGHTEKAPY